MNNSQIAAIVAAVLVAGGIAGTVAVFLPGYLERRAERNTPICIGLTSQRAADKAGCKLP